MQPTGTAHAPARYVLLGALWILQGCSAADGEAREQAAVCVPNASMPCVCPDGLSSTKSCLYDGSGVTACACNPLQDGGSLPGAADAAAPSIAADGAAPGGSDASSQGMPGGGGVSEDAGADAGHAMTSAGCGAASSPPSGDMTIEVGGVERAYIVSVPAAYDANKPHRLVFAWHGLGGTARQIASSFYGLAARSEGSAIFIAAQGLPGTGQQSAFAAWANRNDGDITLTRKLLEWAKTNYCIDVERVFSIGMSNGGMMSNIVGCELGDSFRAIAAMSGGGPRGYAMKPCVGQVAVWISHGNRDTNVPFSYGTMSRDYWRSENHCGTATAAAAPGSCLEYQGCDADFPVQFCEFDGGHMVPSFAAEAAWKFFERF